MYKCKEPKFSNFEETLIDVIWEHPDYGDIPFTASPDDCEAHGRDIYAAALAGAYGQVAPYVAPPPEAEHAPIVPQAVTRRQARLALLEVGKLDDFEEAIAAMDDPNKRRAAEIEYEADTWERSNGFLQTLWEQLGGDESELDELFILAAGL